MLNQYSIWKYILILAIVIPGLFYAAPNLFGDDPGLQIRGARGINVDTSTLSRVEDILKQSEIEVRSIALEEQDIKIRFNSTEDQLTARDKLSLDVDMRDRHTVAMSLLPATPRWLSGIGANPMFLGLDLRGGVHFLMEVDMQSYLKRADDDRRVEVRRMLRDEELRYQTIKVPARGGLEVSLREGTDRERARSIIARQFPDLELKDVDVEGLEGLRGTLSETATVELTQSAIDQNVTALRNRIDELGVAEPIVQRQGEKRIVVQLPGVQDTARAKRILGRTATLDIKLVDEDNAAATKSVPGSRIYQQRNGQKIQLKNRTELSGNNIIDAAASLDTQTGGPIVSITLDGKGAARMQKISGENIGRRMAVVYVEDRSETKRDAEGQPLTDDEGAIVRTKRRIEEVITAPVIRDQLGKRFQIEGLDSVEEARDLSLMLRAGSLAAPVDIVEERTVGPTLGADNISQGFRAVLIGFLLVLVFMIVYYRMFGIVACVALALNLVLVVAVLSLLQATLTLPGVAGIVLTVGMAVDANVLIYERIREEIRAGNTPQASIHTGYDRALTTIVDANITTLIAAVILFAFGTGPIKGFAVTLSFGILTSMFTAIIVTRGIVNLIYGGKRVEQLAI